MTVVLAEGIMADLWRDFWIRETGTGQQVAQLHDRYDDDDDDDDDNDDDDCSNLCYVFIFAVKFLYLWSKVWFIDYVRRILAP